MFTTYRRWDESRTMGSPQLWLFEIFRTAVARFLWNIYILNLDEYGLHSRTNYSYMTPNTNKSEENKARTLHYKNEYNSDR